MQNFCYRIAATMLFAITLVSPAAAETVLRFSNWVPTTHPVYTDVLVKWGENVAKATDNRVKVEFVNGLAKPPAQFDLVRNGVADAAFGVHSYTSDRFILSGGVELPFLAPLSRSASIAYWRLHKKFFEPANEHKGVKLLSLWVHGPADIFTRDKEIKTIDDMKGMKIRVSGGITDEIAVALGSVPFFAPASESYEVISKGVADGIYFPMESVYNFKIAPAIKYALKIPGGLYRSSHYLIMNQAKWESLSNADKAAIESVSGEKLAELAAAMWDAQDKLGQEAMLKGGTVISTASGPLLKDITAKLSRLEADWIAKAKGRGVDGAAALAFFKKEIAAVK